MNIFLSAMRPIFNLLAPTGDVKAIKNIDTILSIIDTIKAAGLMDRITLNMLNVIESKAVAKERIDAFLREKIEMVTVKETKTRGALNITFRGTDLDEEEEVEDETEVGAAIRGARGLTIEINH